ncbi:MAG: hydantoinase/oxoprolinase N-terminal domain-containing protein, partial [Puniceicoccales bacterium]
MGSKPSHELPKWRIAADTGGTFTDIVAWSPSGDRFESKVLSTGNLRLRCLERVGERSMRVESRDLPDGFLNGVDLGEGRRVLEFGGGYLTYEGAPLAEESLLEIETGLSAPVLGAYLVTQTPLAEALPPLSLRVATTRGTNALLEGKGARVTLVVSEGWEDLLRIGDQTRPDLFARPIPERRVLFADVQSVPLRLDRNGTPVGDLRSSLREADESEIVVISLCNGYQNPELEREYAERISSEKEVRIIPATAVSSLPGYLRRTETAVVEGYLAPILDAYLDGIGRAEGVDQLEVMTSAGGIVSRKQFRAVDSLLSGPAGGMIGAVEVAKRAGIGSFLAFDMGGTSTDVSRFDGDLAYR